MSQFTELQEKFFSETGICDVNSQGEPDIDYVNWLESLVKNGSSHSTRSTPLQQPCDSCGRILTTRFYCPVCDNDE